MTSFKRIELRRKRKQRVRVKGSSSAPRLSVFKSNRRVFIQLIDDSKSLTMAGVLSEAIKSGLDKKKAAFEAGKKIGEVAKSKGVKAAIFDRGGYKFHGRIKAVREGAEAGGLVFSKKKKKK